jgi:hypothetical protein
MVTDREGRQDTIWDKRRKALIDGIREMAIPQDFLEHGLKIR